MSSSRGPGAPARAPKTDIRMAATPAPDDGMLVMLWQAGEKVAEARLTGQLWTVACDASIWMAGGNEEALVWTKSTHLVLFPPAWLSSLEPHLPGGSRSRPRM
eukprot:90736-Rhodomonas_salina.1